MNIDIINALLENVTPLKSDCGRLCDAACCKDDEGAGVWLLPGEGAQCPWGTVSDSIMPVTQTPVKLLMCAAPCERSKRPFMCRIFPLTPYFSKKKNRWDVRMDVRAAALCPLYGYGIKALDPEFTQNVRTAVGLLAADEEGIRLLERLEAEEKAYRIEL